MPATRAASAKRRIASARNARNSAPVLPTGINPSFANRPRTSGVVSAAANRRAIRVTQEPLDLFRRYMATYALAQAYCHFSPALIANLERHWNAHNRKL